MSDPDSIMKINAAIDTAIEVHMMWIARFQIWVKGINREKFDPEVIYDDTACAFGKWLHSSLDCFPDKKTYEEVKALHKEFHATASELARQSKQLSVGISFQAELDKLNRQSRQLIAMLCDVKRIIRQSGSHIAHMQADQVAAP